MKFVKIALLPLPLVFLFSTHLFAQQDTIIVVPFKQSDPNMPHPAYEGAPVTLKAVIKNAQCGQYDVWWDTNRNGIFGDDYKRRVNRNGTTGSVWEMGGTYTIPNVSEDTIITINVRVVNRCNNQAKYATMKFFVHDFKPDTNPLLWTDKQVEIMSAVAANESMWFLHRTMFFSGSITSSGIRGRNPYYQTMASNVKLLIRNGHLPAYPPGTINTHNQSLPTNWNNENNTRWWSDPYAETCLRLINELADRFSNTAISAAAEDSTNGYNSNFTPKYSTRITGTNDSRGVLINVNVADRGTVGYCGEALDALSHALPALGGTTVQIGPLAGSKWEFVLQQMVDYLAYAQIDGFHTGHWYYSPINGSSNRGLTETGSFVAVGLNNAEKYGAKHGLVVNNYVKYRTANAILSSQIPSGTHFGAAKRFVNITRHSLQLTGGLIGICKWLGVDQFSATDTVKPFPNEAPNVTRGQLRTAFNNYINYVNSNFTKAQARDGFGWTDGYWQDGDYLVKDTNGIYNQPKLMHIFSQYLLATGYRVKNVLDTVGSYNWQKMFNTSIIRAQERYAATNQYHLSGRILQQYCPTHNHSCAYGNGHYTTAQGGNILTPKDFVHDSVIGCVRTITIDSITACDSLRWIDGVTYTASNYTAKDTLTSQRGCDSIIHLKLTIKNSVLVIDTVVACGSYTWIDGKTYTASNHTATKIYAESAANGCDSIVKLMLTINHPVYGVDTQTACGSYRWIDSNIYASNNTTARHTIVGGASNGCDSIVTLNLTITQPVHVVDTQTACGSYKWIDGNTYASNNTTARHVISGGASNGCDSIITLNLTIKNPVNAVDTQTACGSFTWIDGNTYASNNTTAKYTIANGAANGCDSIITLNLTINQPVNVVDTQTACGSYTWIDGNTYASNNNTAQKIYANGAANGCDSIVTLNLTINNPSSSSSSIVTCSNYQWPVNNTVYTGSGIFRDTLRAANGCDSVVTLNLTINQPSASSLSKTVCGSYTWPLNSKTYTTSGTYRDTLTNSNNCDSVITLNLTINQSTSSATTATACRNYVWAANNKSYSSSGTYTDTLTNSVGCDSVVSLTLTINQPVNVVDTQTACGSYTWIDGNTYASNNNTAQKIYTNAAANGCDSIVTLNLTINNPIYVVDTQSACGSYTWIDGNTYSSNNTTAQKVYANAAANGCDSIVTLNLTIKKPSRTNVSATACGSYTWAVNNTTYSSSGIYYDTLTNSQGCDSVIALTLTINPPSQSSISLSSCGSYTWPLNSVTYTSSGSYSDTLTNSFNCDSIVTLNLTIYPASGSSMSVSACHSYRWSVNNLIYTSSGTYSDTLRNRNGCDSVVTLHLTINQPVFSVENKISCKSYTWPVNGKSFTQSGIYKDTLRSSVGCDSIITLNLTINQPTKSSISKTSCGSYTWPLNGTTYTQSGTYVDTIMSSLNCDSIVTLHLILKQNTSSTQSVKSCGSYTWPLNSKTYTASGIYKDTITNINGCDSVVSLNLTINQPSNSSLSETACDSYFWPLNNKTYSASGVYSYTLKNANNCDSVVTLNLTINNSSETVLVDSSCTSYTWSVTGKTYNESGKYSRTFAGLNGCDSILTLDLLITNINRGISSRIFNKELRLRSDESGGSYQWFDCSNGLTPLLGENTQNFVPEKSGNYSVEVRKNNCVDTSICFAANVLGIADGSNSQNVRIFPNPTDGAFEIILNKENRMAEITVYSSAGQVVHNETFYNQSRLHLQLSLRNAVYYVEILDESGNKSVHRLVVGK